MTEETEDLASQYRAMRPKYKRYAADLEHLLSALIKAEQIPALIDSRAKTVDSFVEKASRPGKTYLKPLTEISDLAGLRIVVQSLADVGRIVDLVADEFEVDLQRSVDKGQELAVDQFGYVARQLIVRLKKPRANQREFAPYEGIWAEIQVRTALQDAWARLEYLLVYKAAQDAPASLQRRLYAVAATLEILDREFDAILTDANRLVDEARSQLAGSLGSVPITVESLTAYLQSSPTVERWAQVIRDLDVTITGPGAVGRDVQMAQMADLHTIGDIEQLLVGSASWGSEYLSRFYANDARNLIERLGALPSRSTDINGIIDCFLIANHRGVFTEQVLEDELGWGEARRALDAADGVVPRI